LFYVAKSAGSSNRHRNVTSIHLTNGCQTNSIPQQQQ